MGGGTAVVGVGARGEVVGGVEEAHCVLWSGGFGCSNGGCPRMDEGFAVRFSELVSIGESRSNAKANYGGS